MCFRPAAVTLNKCYKCGKINKPIATVCVECGAPLKPGHEPCPQCETMKEPLAVCPNCGYVPEVECPKCHTKNPVTNEQCTKCGFKATKMPPPPGQSAGNFPPKVPPAPPKVPPVPPKKPGT
ncbi:MAG: zinc ribbon domain-containing protein [Anaerolineales bacterium]|nr:zinc ribbon domain-containing protein [Anaerolineales bacterium]